MKKLWLVFGLGVGFVLGSRAGSGPYEQLRRKIAAIAGRPEVQDTVAQVRDAAEERVQDTVTQVKHAVREKVDEVKIQTA